MPTRTSRCGRASQAMREQDGRVRCEFAARAVPAAAAARRLVGRGVVPPLPPADRNTETVAPQRVAEQRSARVAVDVLLAGELLHGLADRLGDLAQSHRPSARPRVVRRSRAAGRSGRRPGLDASAGRPGAGRPGCRRARRGRPARPSAAPGGPRRCGTCRAVRRASGCLRDRCRAPGHSPAARCRSRSWRRRPGCRRDRPGCGRARGTTSRATVLARRAGRSTPPWRSSRPVARH